jgi:hypothetical protein
MTRLRIPQRFSDQLPAGEYEVLYVSPAAGVVQIAPTRLSLGQKDKPAWDALQRHPGVHIECAHCRDWFEIADIPIDEIHGWRCWQCTAGTRPGSAA